MPQVYQTPYDPREPFARTTFPDQQTYQRHIDTFCELIGGDVGTPTQQSGLDPNRIYVRIPPIAGAIPKLFRQARPEEVIADTDQLVAELVARSGRQRTVLPDLLAPWLRYSMWQGLRSGARSKILISNDNAPFASAHAVVEVEELEQQFALADAGEDISKWLDEIYAQLAKVTQ